MSNHSFSIEIEETFMVREEKLCEPKNGGFYHQRAALNKTSGLSCIDRTLPMIRITPEYSGILNTTQRGRRT
jgi:hypothetical protein